MWGFLNLHWCCAGEDNTYGFVPPPVKAAIDLIGQSSTPHALSSLEVVGEYAMPTAKLEQSWRDLFLKKQRLGEKLQFHAPTRVGAKVVVKPPQEAVDEGITKWESSLVGQFLEKSLPFWLVKRTVDALWGQFSKVETFSLENGLFLFKFDDIQRLLPMDLSLKEILVWIKILHLPIEYWNPTCLIYVASGVGKPLYADASTEANSRLRFARVFVEVDIDAQFPEEIEVDMGNGHSFVVGIEYPWIPIKCTKCSVFGHLTRNCGAVGPSSHGLHRFLWGRKIIDSNHNQFPALNDVTREDTENVGFSSPSKGFSNLTVQQVIEEALKRSSKLKFHSKKSRGLKGGGKGSTGKDFNVTKSPYEKLGGLVLNTYEQEFLACTEAISVDDHPTVGSSNAANEGVMITTVSNLMEFSISYATKVLLEQAVTVDEVKSTIFSLGSDKAPGPDGFTACFFKKSWPIVGSDVCKAIQSFFQSRALLKEVNSTIITLVPKVPNPSSITEFRPITCFADIPSIKLIKEGLEEFRMLSGLSVNQSKSKLPMKYLGMPLISGKLSYDDCVPLIEKITARINSWTVYGHRTVYDAASSINAKPARSEDLVDIQSKLSMVHIGDCDKAIWMLNSSGKFTCADTWQHLKVKQIEVNWWKLVWFTNAIPKHSFIGWLTIRNRLVTKDRLLQWGLGVDPMCLFCRQNLEDQDHLFFKCPFTNRIWKNIMGLCLVSDASDDWHLLVDWGI
uniref:Reverse transcriptase zinc-binding domain-containing protein n=1 Tax=Fagus sylvatica TaxID=28930 RepID=A0A2N9IVN5_FAGSY